MEKYVDYSGNVSPLQSLTSIDQLHGPASLRLIEWLVTALIRQIAVVAVIALVLVTALTGCSTFADRDPLPLALTNQAIIPGVPDARFWGDEWPKGAVQRLRNYSDADIRKFNSGVYGVPHHYLAISGGGANGAFGAGLLTGWTKSGTRPEFTMVTGISTGALAAPFAFLGSDYDGMLKEMFTTTRTVDIFKKRIMLTALWSDALADTQPLRNYIEQYLSADLVEAIAAEHRKGRRLFIGTANLDAGRAVIWNLGAIAVSDYKRKLALIHDVVQASSAIPVAFSPVIIPVEANGRSYDEMHADGGTVSQVFVYPTVIDWRLITKKLKVVGNPRIYVIMNSFFESDYRGTIRALLPIARRSIDILIRTQGIGDLYRIYSLCVRDGNDFNLAYIPSNFIEKPTEAFDPLYMSALFERGYQMAQHGYPWKKTLPGFKTSKGLPRRK